MSIKVQINDKTYTTPTAVNLAIKHGLRSIKLINFIRTTFWSVTKFVIFAAAFVAVWYVSALFHESDLITACKDNHQFELLHPNWKLANCTVERTN